MNWMKKLAIAAVGVVALVSPSLAEELTLFAWSEYIPQPVLEGFEKETGIKVRYEAYASNEEMLAKLQGSNGKYDVIQPSEYMTQALISAGKLEKLDHARLPNLKHIDPLYLSLPHDKGSLYSVPYMSGTVGIVYNKKKIAQPIKGYGDVFGGKYSGRILSLDDGREIMSWVLSTQGRDINDFSDANLAALKPVMAEWMKQIKLYDSDSPKVPLMGGDVDVGIVWSGEAAVILNEKPDDFAWVLPSEGAHRFVDTLAVPKGSRHVEAAHKFMNYVLRPDVSKLISDEFPYTNPNVDARKLLDAGALKNPASYPPADTKLDTFRDIGERSKVLDELYTSLKSK